MMKTISLSASKVDLSLIYARYVSIVKKRQDDAGVSFKLQYLAKFSMRPYEGLLFKMTQYGCTCFYLVAYSRFQFYVGR